MTNYDERVTSCARCGKYLTEKDKIYSMYIDGIYEPYCSYKCVVRENPLFKDSAKKFFGNEK